MHSSTALDGADEHGNGQDGAVARHSRPIHPLWLRVTHWLNAFAVVLMVTSGWRIYDASPLFQFMFPPDITLGGWLGGALQWHFAAMWLLALNGLIYLSCNIVTRRLARRFFPVTPRAFLADLLAALKGKLTHADPRRYNTVQRAAYLFVMFDICLLVLSGLVLWKSVQFPVLRDLMGGYDTARLIHFFAMSGLVAFVAVHVAMVALVPSTLLHMIRGALMDKIGKPGRMFSDSDGALLLKEAVRVAHPSRRAFLQRSLTLGGLAMLTGCSLSDNAGVDTALTRISRFNDDVQGLLFDPNKLAPTYPDSMITRPFPFNAYYGEDEIREVDGDAYRLELSGLFADKRPWTLSRLRALPQTDQVTRHICVEGWSAIGKWGGVRFSDFLRRTGADLSARYVGFKCADDYYTSIDMPTALHPQTLLALSYDGQVLPPRYGFPMKLRMPTKLGYKNPKHIKAIFVTNTYPGGYWEDQGYNWFGGS